MTKLWDDLKKNMKDWSTAAVEKAEEVSKIAVAKTEELTKISKVKIEIHQLQRDQSKSYEKIGRSVVDHFDKKKTLKSDELDDVVALSGEIKELAQSIHEKELEIKKIKEESDLTEEEVKAVEDVVEEVKEEAEEK